MIGVGMSRRGIILRCSAMAKIYGGKNGGGGYLRSLIFRNKLISIGALAVLVAVVFIFSNYSKILTGWAWLIGLLGFIFLIQFLSALVDATEFGFSRAENGLGGEKIILRELSRLSDEYVIFHGLQFRENCDVDFIVIGPTGIYAIDAKSHKGRIGYDGEQLTRDGHRLEKNILSQIMSEAMDVHAFLLSELEKDYFVKPIIVFSSPWARVRFGNTDVKNVRVIGKKWLRKTIIENETEKLSREVVQKIVEVLRKKEQDAQVER